MNREDVRKLAAATASRAQALARQAGKAPPPAPTPEPKPKAKKAKRAKAAQKRPGPVPAKPIRLQVVGGKDVASPRIRISADAIARARAKAITPEERARITGLIKPYQPAPGVLPSGKKVAMDSAFSGGGALADWSGGWFLNGGWFEGQTFLGYPILAEMAQRTEYRKASERMSTEVTRNWIKLVSTSKDRDNTELIKEIDDFLKDIKLRDAAQQAVFLDGTMGRGHWYLDTGDTDDLAELKSPLGDGRNEISKGKISPKHPLRRIQVLDPTWTYPAAYNAANPLKPDWLNPSTWFSMGIEIHSSRLLTFVGRPVPDLFKPAFNFGGLSLSQMMQPFVTNWTSVRQHIAKVVANFSKNGIKTDLQQLLAPSPNGAPSTGDDLMSRLQYYTALSDSNGLLVLNKDSEEFFQFNTPLGTLDALQAQSLEQLCLPSGMPVVVYLGLTPKGLNASSEGEMQAWETWVSAFQPHFFDDRIQRVIDFSQLSLRGVVDPSIGYEWVPLRSQSAKEIAEQNKMEADRDTSYVDRGVIDPLEVRQRLAKDPRSGYSHIDPDDVPEAPQEEEEGAEGEDGEHEEGGEGADLPFASDRQWEESDHPRDQGGRFTAGSNQSVYHGSESKFESFDPQKVGQRDPGHLGKGFYFSTDPNVARTNKHRVETQLNVQNPLELSLPDFKTDKRDVVRQALGLPKDATADQITTALRERGHDAVILDYTPAGYRHQEIMVPDQGQIGKLRFADPKEAAVPVKPDPTARTKKAIITDLLTKGTTAKEVLQATGWPSVSMPAQAAAAGMHLEKFKEDGVTKYRGTPMTEEELWQRQVAKAEAKAKKQRGMPIVRGPRGRDKATYSLLEHLADIGGIKPGPDVDAIFGGTNPFVPGFGRLIRKNGQSLDRARESAVEAGYLHDAGAGSAGQNSSTVRQLLDAMDAENRGTKQYRAGQEHQGETGTDPEEERFRMEEALDSSLDELGMSANDVSGPLRDRTIEIMSREGVSDPIAAYERAVMEEDERGISQGTNPKRADFVPGWDVDERRAAPRKSSRSQESVPF